MIVLNTGRSILPPDTFSSWGCISTRTPFRLAHSRMASSCTLGEMKPSPSRLPTRLTLTYPSRGSMGPSIARQGRRCEYVHVDMSNAAIHTPKVVAGPDANRRAADVKHPLQGQTPSSL